MRSNNDRAHDLLDMILSIGRAVNHDYIIQEVIDKVEPYDVFHTEFGTTILLTRLEKSGVLRKLNMPEGIVWGIVKTEFKWND